jgi:MFS family permease
VAYAFAAAGFGSMVAALAVPRLLDKTPDRPVMLIGATIMGVGVLAIGANPGLTAMLPVWMIIGLGWSLVQTPSGRIVNRSAAPSDRSAYYSAQFALSHAAWLIAYPIAGQLGATVGLLNTALIMGGSILLFTLLAGLFWPRQDEPELIHKHELSEHRHAHTHGPHHEHQHSGEEGPEPHSHPHQHPPVEHKHPFVIDEHHGEWPKAPA